MSYFDDPYHRFGQESLAMRREQESLAKRREQDRLIQLGIDAGLPREGLHLHARLWCRLMKT